MFMWMNKSVVSAEIELPCNVGAKHQNPTRYGVLPNVSAHSHFIHLRDLRHYTIHLA